MDYPGSKITLPVRRALLCAFIAAFFIISPLLILYTAGYRYDWVNGILKETGTINVDVMPRSAKIYLDGEKLSGKIPLRLPNVKPKKYIIKITAPGYYDWEKEIDVKNKQTVYIKEISLLQKNNPILITAGPVKQVSISPNNDYLVFLLQNNIPELWLRDIDKQKNYLLTKLPAAKNISVSWARDNTFFTISSGEAPYDSLLIIDAEKPDKQIDLVKILKSSITKFQWKDAIEPELFLSTKTKLISYWPASNRQSVVVKNDFMDWYFEGGQLWVARLDKIKNNVTVIKDVLGFSSIFKVLDAQTILGSETNPTGINLNIFTAKNNSVLLKKADRDEMILVTQDKNYTIPGNKFIISDYNDWWLTWTPWELTTYSAGEAPYLLYRSGEKLQDVLPLDEYNTLGLFWAGKATVLFPYYYVSHGLFDFSVISAAADSKGKTLYFSGNYEGRDGLWSLKY